MTSRVMIDPTGFRQTLRPAICDGLDDVALGNDAFDAARGIRDHDCTDTSCSKQTGYFLHRRIM